MYLVEHMREDEIEQFKALAYRDEFNSDEAATLFLSKQGPKFTLLGKDGIPWVSGGYEPVAPGVMQSWMLGSTEGWTHWRDITKASRWLAGLLLQEGTRRLQGSVLPSRCKAVEWFKRGLGMSYEGTRRSFGYHGEDVMDFALIGGRNNGL
jgi:hypothetical protein